MIKLKKASVALMGVSAIINGANAVGVAIDNAESLDTTLHANSDYQLELANGTTNVFNITKYQENAETGELTPQVYNVVFNNQLGNADATGVQVQYFKWKKDNKDGGYKLVAGNSGSYDLKVGLGEDVYVNQIGVDGGVKFIGPGQEISSYSGTFIGNESAFGGGVLKNEGKVDNLIGHFIGNSTAGTGGGIHNVGTIGSLSGDFIANSAVNGGAFRNDKEIGSVTGDFIGNSANYGGAIDNSNGTIGSITGDFIQNSADFSGGAVYNEHGTIGTIDGDFIGNTSGGSYGGAIYSSGTIDKINGNFIGNSAYNGGAIDNLGGTIGTVTGDFIGNTSSADGGAILNSGKMGLLAQDDSIEFTGNIAGTGSSVRSEAIYMNGYEGGVSLNMNSYGANKIVVNDGILGVGSNAININNGLAGDGSKIDAAGKSFGVVEFNNNVQGVAVNVSGGTLKAGSYTGGVVSLGSDSSITTVNSIAKFIEADVKVANNAKLLIGADVNGNASVSFDADSSLTLENGGILAFEEKSSLDFDGTFSAENSTLFFELSDYVAGLEGDETFDLDWTFATFENADAAADALAGFGNFGNDLGILKGDKDSEGLWFDVVQNGNELKVVGVIPEPATIGLLGLVGGALLAVRRRFCA